MLDHDLCRKTELLRVEANKIDKNDGAAYSYLLKKADRYELQYRNYVCLLFTYVTE